jgi:hypothetical protein
MTPARHDHVRSGRPDRGTRWPALRMLPRRRGAAPPGCPGAADLVRAGAEPTPVAMTMTAVLGGRPLHR